MGNNRGLTNKEFNMFLYLKNEVNGTAYESEGGYEDNTDRKDDIIAGILRCFRQTESGKEELFYDSENGWSWEPLEVE